MKQLNFTFPGGMKVTQERIAFLQSAWRELAEGLAMGSGHLTGPYAVGGALASFPAVDEGQLTMGWIYYEGELVAVRNNLGLAGIPVGNEAFVVINDDNATLPYNDSSTPTAQLDKYVTLESYLSSALEGPTQFKLTSLKPYGREKDWADLAGTFTGSIIGSAECKKVLLTNEVMLRGNFGPNTAATFVGTYVTSATLPVGYWPLQDVYFPAVVTMPFGETEDTGKDYLQQINCKILTTGELQVLWLNSTSTAGYNIAFELRFSLE